MLFLLSIITYLDRVAIALASVRIQTDLGIRPEQWGLVLGAFALSYAIFEIPTGAMGDRTGPRRVLTRIVVWWSAFTALTGAAFNYWGLVATRFFFGAGEAGAYPNSSSSISRWFPADERGRAHGVVWMASRLGGALSPLIVVPMQIAFGWRTTFYVLGALGVVWGVAWYIWYRDYPAEKPGVSAAELAELGGGVKPVHHGLEWRVALRSGNFWIILMMYHTYCWGAFFYLSWMPTYLQRGRGFSEDEMKVYAMLPFAAGIIGNLFGGWLSDLLVRRRGLKFGRLSVGTAGLALAAACMLGAALTPSRGLAVLFLTLGFGSMDCMLPVSWAVCLDVGRKYAGTVTGSMNMAGQVGSFLTSVAFGYIVAYFGGDYNKPLIPMAAMLLISALLYTRIDPTKELCPETATAPEPAPAVA